MSEQDTASEVQVFTPSDSSPFNPRGFLTKVNGGDYLEVKWRLVWWRMEHPEGRMETKLIHHEQGFAIFRCRVEHLVLVEKALVGSDTELALGTGWGSESSDDFRDYIEKAETKAIGRALASVGYGTQFAYTDSEMATGRIADSPVGGGGSQRGNYNGGGNNRGSGGGSGSPATPRQIKFLYAIAQEAGLTEEELEHEVKTRFNTTVAALQRRDASQLIEQLTARREQQRNGGAGTMTPRSENPPVPREPQGITSAQQRFIHQLLKERGLPVTWVSDNYGRESGTLTAAEADDVIKVVQKLPPSKAIPSDERLPDEWVKRITDLQAEAVWDDKRLTHALRETYKVATIAELSREQAEDLGQRLKKDADFLKEMGGFSNTEEDPF